MDIINVLVIVQGERKFDFKMWPLCLFFWLVNDSVAFPGQYIAMS